MYRGGQVVHYGKDTEWHLNWKPLNSHNLDCGPNCFSLLRYSDWNTSNELARRSPYGIHTETIVKLLDEAYGEGHIWQFISNYNQYGENDLMNKSPNFELNNYGEPIIDSEHINTYLYKNEATIAYIERQDMLHFFVVLRDEGYHAIDAQIGKTMPLRDYMDYMETIGFNNRFYIMTSPEPMSEPNQVTMEMVKRYFPIKKKRVKSHKEKNKKGKSKSRSRKG
jgi:hypothetical protein